MIPKNLEKIRVCSLNKHLYLDELPLNWTDFRIKLAYRQVDKKSFCIIKQEHKLDSYPEE